MLALWISDNEFQAWRKVLADIGVEISNPQWKIATYDKTWYASIVARADWMPLIGDLWLTQIGNSENRRNIYLNMGVSAHVYPQLFWPMQSTALDLLLQHSLFASFARCGYGRCTYVRISVSGLNTFVEAIGGVARSNTPILSIADWVRHLWLNPIVIRKYRSWVTVQAVPALDATSGAASIVVVVRARFSRFGGGKTIRGERQKIYDLLFRNNGQVLAVG